LEEFRLPERSKTEQQVFDLIENRVTEAGLDLIDVLYVKENSERILRVVIDKAGGISLDDCSDTSLSIDPLLDQADIIPGAYSLEVSSPGIDRPLSTDRDLIRNIGILVEVHPAQVKGNREWYEGILQSVTDDELCILLDEPFIKGVRPKTNGQEMRFLRKDVTLVKKAIRF
jgi:ribosome maturation factor RimP